MTKVVDAKDELIERFEMSKHWPQDHDGESRIACLLSWIKHDDLKECVEHLENLARQHRYTQARKLRQSGLTYKAIGQHFGVSSTRAGQLVAIAKAKKI